MTLEGNQDIDTFRKLRRFYVLLSEWFIGLYPDSAALSIGPINRDHLPEKVQKSYNALINSYDVDDEIRFRVESDFELVSHLIKQHDIIPSKFHDERASFLKSQEDVRARLTKEALKYARTEPAQKHRNP